MKKHILKIAIILAVLFGLFACEEESDMAIDRVASPVLVMVSPASKTPDLITVSATFLELDKSGILDHTIGIDSIPVPNLSIKVAKYGGAVLTTLTTDAAGKVTLSSPTADLTGTTKLEWSGEYKGVKFTQISSL
jgi:hypothetical protein